MSWSDGVAELHANAERAKDPRVRLRKEAAARSRERKHNPGLTIVPDEPAA